MATQSETLIKEYESLRTEVVGRLGIAFTQLGYFGAVVAFAFPATKSTGFDLWAIALALLGLVLLLLVSIVNWMWVSRIADHLRVLEGKIMDDGGVLPLKWEGIAEKISRWVLFPPKKYPIDNMICKCCKKSK